MLHQSEAEGAVSEVARSFGTVSLGKDWVCILDAIENHSRDLLGQVTRFANYIPSIWIFNENKTRQTCWKNISKA